MDTTARAEVATATSSAKPFGGWKPLERDISPLVSSGRSSTALNLEHGVSGFIGKPLSNSSSLPSLVAPAGRARRAWRTHRHGYDDARARDGRLRATKSHRRANYY